MSKTPFRRPVFLRHPSEMLLRKHKRLKVVRPLYVMPESPMHWFKTFFHHHRNELGMKQSDIDLCLLFQMNNECLPGLTDSRVDDTISANTSSFLEEEEKASVEFLNKGKEEISGTPVRFNIADNYHKGNDTFIQQQSYITEIRK